MTDKQARGMDEKMTTKDAQLHLVLAPELLAKLKDIAKRDRRTLSETVRIILERAK